MKKLSSLPLRRSIFIFLAAGFVFCVDAAHGSPLSCKNCVGSAQLKKNSVKTAKISNGAVTKDKLGSDIHAIGLEGVAAISAADFTPDGQNMNCFRDDDSLSWTLGGGAGICCLEAPVRVPDEATITAFEVTAKFGGIASVDIDLQLKNVTTGDNSVDVAQVLFTPGSQTQRLSQTGISKLIDAKTSVLYIRGCLLTTGDTLHGARVFFD